MMDGLRSYIQVATGLTEVTATKAREIVSSLLSQGLTLSTRAPEVIGQVQSMADDLMSTGKDNREMLVGLIRSEVDRAVARIGVVREDELAALRRQVERLQAEVESMKRTSGPKPGRATGATVLDGVGAGAAKPKKKKVVVQPEEAQ